MGWENAANTLKQFGIEKFEHVETRTHAATTGWGVKWDEAAIARDIMQNFYDANRDNLSQIQVTANARTVQICAPSIHDLELLFYMASTKGPNDVGQYGEGFKVAVTCLLRDHRVTPIARSGNQVLCIQLADKPVSKTEHFPLVYHFFESVDTVDGTLLLLPNCSQKLIRELERGLYHFFYDANPLLGAKAWASYGDDFSIYHSSNSGGCIFYRNLKRGEIEDIPLVLVINKEYKAIESKIKNDRDRNAFGDELMDLFYRTFGRYAFSYSWQGQRIILEAARDRWMKGHPLLAALAYNVGYQNTLFKEEIVNAIFGDAFYARSTSQEPAKQLRFDGLEKDWQKAGKKALPSYFAKFGVLCAERHCDELERRARNESLSSGSRSPSRAERKSLTILKELLSDIAPELAAIFNKRGATYTVADTEAALGALRKERGFRSPNVFLAAELFVSEFSRTVAVYLHEHAHIFGYDGDRGFTDALTELIESVIVMRKEMDRYETAWDKARQEVEQERGVEGDHKKDDKLQAKLARMTEDELRKLVGRLPQATLKRLMRRDNQAD